MADFPTVAAKTVLQLRGFSVPNFVIVATSDVPSNEEKSSLKLEDLSQEAVDTLAQDFIDRLYTKVGMHSPFVMNVQAG